MELSIEELQKICVPENIIITRHAAKRLNADMNSLEEPK